MPKLKANLARKQEREIVISRGAEISDPKLDILRLTFTFLAGGDKNNVRMETSYRITGEADGYPVQEDNAHVAVVDRIHIGDQAIPVGVLHAALMASVEKAVNAKADAQDRRAAAGRGDVDATA